ncbi:MAG: hypothetical protein HUU47_08295 [Bacteroidetes bacterium]|nr:hypothetical protein [Bacteroidota bacterium]
MLGCASCTLIFLEPNPFTIKKIIFTALLSIAVWIIYATDHLVDSFVFKGKSGILRHDFHYRYRYFFITVILFLAILEVWVAIKLKNELFVKNAFYLSMIMPVYFVLKFLKFLNSIIKMLFVSAVFSAAVVLLFNSKNLFFDFFSFEVLAMMLLALLNQLVLEHFENRDIKYAQNYFSVIAFKVFLWLSVVLILISILNLYAIPYTLSVFMSALSIFNILKREEFFTKNLLYRFWADFSLVLIFPLLKLFLFIQSFLTNLL